MGTSLSDLLGGAKKTYGPQAGINLLQGGAPVSNIPKAPLGKYSSSNEPGVAQKALGYTMADFKKAVGEEVAPGPAVIGPDGQRVTKDCWTMPWGSETLYFINRSGSEQPTQADLVMVTVDEWQTFKNTKDPKQKQEILQRYASQAPILGGQ